MQNIESEIRYKVDESFWKPFFEKCRKNGEFVRHEKQHDEYWRPAHENWPENDFIPEWLSIRERGEKAFVNYKDWRSDLSRDEFETVVDNAESMRRIFAAIDMDNFITVDKERDIFMMGDFEVAMDFCEGLGHFIEVEVKGRYESVEEAEAALRKFVAGAGLDKFEEDHKGYPWLLLEKKKGILKS
jgi:predicted adenylyl cyclase CyaB